MTIGLPGVSHRLRVSAPPAATRIEWPAAFGTRFAIFVDTEEEFDWSRPLSKDMRSVSAVTAIPPMHARFAERGIGLTYLVDHPVATDGRAIDILREVASDGRSAIGAQLHPWVNPPHDEAPSPVASYAGNLPRALEAAKLDRLTDAIETAFGARPSAYRAGRYGIGPDTIALLAERGYRLDTSMRARHSYAHDGGPDFGAIGNDAFRVGPDGCMIELPLTTVFTGHVRALGPRLHPVLGRIPLGRAVFARTGLLSRVPLTPEGTPVDEAMEAIRIAIGEELRVLNFAFHSPSLVPGNTPYVRDARDLARFNGWWESVLDLLDRLGVRPVSLDALIASATLPSTSNLR